MLNLFFGVKGIKLLSRCTKIEKFFTQNNYISENRVVHISELQKAVLTDQKLKETFSIMQNNKTIKVVNNDYFYLNTKSTYGMNKMLFIIFGTIALALLLVIISTIIAFL